MPRARVHFTSGNAVLREEQNALSQSVSALIRMHCINPSPVFSCKRAPQSLPAGCGEVPEKTSMPVGRKWRHCHIDMHERVIAELMAER
eukprot:5446545-Alexandrium_andersonii.AAC.1